MKKSLTSLVQEEFEVSKRHLLSIGATTPRLIMYNGESRPVALCAQFVDMADKDRFAEVARMAMIAFDAKQYVLITEAWTTSYKKEDIPTHIPAFSECKDRKEALFITGGSVDEDSIGGLAILTRDRKGDLVEVGELDTSMSDAGLISGRFANLIPKVRVSDEVREEAQRRLKSIFSNGELRPF